MSIIENRKAFHDYFIEERYEAGIALEGWEVKAIRGGRSRLMRWLSHLSVWRAYRRVFRFRRRMGG